MSEMDLVKRRRAAGMTDDEILADLAEEVELGNSAISKQIEVNSGLGEENARLRVKVETHEEINAENGNENIRLEDEMARLREALGEIGRHKTYKEMDSLDRQNTDSMTGNDYFIGIARAALPKDEPTK